MSKFKHSWQQRKIWREAKRAWRAEVKRYNARYLNRVRVFLGQRDITDNVYSFTADTVADVFPVADQNGFQVFEPLGLSYVEVTTRLICDQKFRNWLENLFRLGQSHQLRVYQGDHKAYQMRVLFQSITWSTSGSIVLADVRFKSTGKVQRG